MKKTLAILSIMVLISFQEEKKLKVEASWPTWQKHINKLEVIRRIADESNLGNQEVKFITRTIDSLEMFIVPQLQPQLISDSLKRK